MLIQISPPIEFQNADANAKPIYRYGGSYLLESVQSFQEEKKAAGNPRDELTQYLESGVESAPDVMSPIYGICSYIPLKRGVL